MSSEAITRNDLSAILNEVLPPTPSEYKKLLWSNPSPTSAFNAQTIQLDLSNYDAVEIIIRADTANTYTIAPIITEVGKGGIAFNSTAYNSVRQFTTTTSGITFTGATYYSAYGNWSASSTNALIPVKIYGIKYERVLPPQADALEWRLAGSATSTTHIDLPANWNELLIYSVDTGYLQSYQFTVVRSVLDLVTNNRPLVGGASQSSATYWISVFVSDTQVWLGLAMANGSTNRNASVTTRVYYR